MNFTFTKGITHPGVFHADDVFSTAFLKILNPDIEVERRFVKPDEAIPADTIVFDIGNGEFDHHDAKHNKIRETTGIPYAAFGLLWRAFGHEVVDDAGWEVIETELVSPIDLADNGRQKNALSSAISTMNPFWDSDESPDEQFWKAVELATTILKRSIAHTKSTANAAAIVNDAIAKQNHGVIVLDSYLPWQPHIKTDAGVRFCVFPSNRGGWNLQTINSDDYPLPRKWTVALPDGMTFCHKGCFMAACVDKETAVKYALEASAQFE